MPLPLAVREAPHRFAELESHLSRVNQDRMDLGSIDADVADFKLSRQRTTRAWHRAQHPGTLPLTNLSTGAATPLAAAGKTLQFA